MNTQINYQTRREKDCHIEKICADFADRFYFDKWTAENLSLSYERVTDKERQFKGEDLLLKKDGRIIARVDEKAKTYKCLNEVIGWPSFEITFLNRAGERSAGWFANPESTTTHYAYVSIASKKSVEPGNEWELEEPDISRMVYAFVNSAKLKKRICDETGKAMEDLVKDADALVYEYETCLIPDDSMLRRRYGDCIHLTYSPRMKEKPVNLVVRRDWLRRNGLITEIYVDRDRYEKYDAPRGVLNPEKLYRQ